MLLIEKKYFIRNDRATILYWVNLWLKPVSATGARMEPPYHAYVNVILGNIPPQHIGAV